MHICNLSYQSMMHVKDNYLIFGVAVKNADKIEHYHSTFLAYMKEKHNAVIHNVERSEKWIMPHIQPGCPVDYGTGRVFFAGEAAGFLNPMGEGISAGLESGYAIAKAIEEVDLHRDFDLQAIYSGYKNNCSELKGYMERQWRFVANMSVKFKHMK